MNRVVELAKKYWFDALIVVGIAIALYVVVRDQGKYPAGPEGTLWLDVLIVIGFLVPPLFRRRWPVGALVTPAVVAAGTSFLDHAMALNNFVFFIAAHCIAALFGMRPDRRMAILGLVLIYATSVVLTLNDPDAATGDIAWQIPTFGVVWTVGFALGGRFREADVAKRLAQQAEQEREEQARRAVAEERARIARELHDVVGHSVSVMTVQAAAVRRMLEPDQEKEVQALLVVEQTGREALAEMRRMVGVLRDSAAVPDSA